MKHQNCPKYHNCDEQDCPAFMRQCIIYRKYMTKRAVRQTGIPYTDEVEREIQSIMSVEPFDGSRARVRGFVFQTVSPSQALARLIVAVSQSPTNVRVYGFHNVVQAGLEDELPDETIIFINSISRISDPLKQYSVIESFISRCREVDKTVIHLHKANFTTLAAQV